jgi:hypothetical protein
LAFVRSGEEGGAHERDGGFEVAGDEGGGDAEDAVAGALQEAISARVEVLAARVDFPIDLDDEASFGADEVGDVAAHDHLAAEGESQAAAFEYTNSPAVRRRTFDESCSSRLHRMSVTPRDRFPLLQRVAAASAPDCPETPS